MTEQIAKRDVVLPSEIMDISPTTPEKGMSGYYLTPLIGAYFVHVPGQIIGEILQPRDSTVADFIRRGEDDQYLTLWKECDYFRLNIKGEGVFLAPEQGPENIMDDGQNNNPLTNVVSRRLKRVQGE
jgi:hypothetical protein